MAITLNQRGQQMQPEIIQYGIILRHYGTKLIDNKKDLCFIKKKRRRKKKEQKEEEEVGKEECFMEKWRAEGMKTKNGKTELLKVAWPPLAWHDMGYVCVRAKSQFLRVVEKLRIIFFFFFVCLFCFCLVLICNIKVIY